MRLEASDSVREWPRLPNLSVRPCRRSPNPPPPEWFVAATVLAPLLLLLVVIAIIAPAGLVQDAATIEATPSEQLPNVAKFDTEPSAVCAVMGAQAVAELSIAMSYVKKLNLKINQEQTDILLKEKMCFVVSQ